MKVMRIIIGIVFFAAVIAAGTVVLFYPEKLKPEHKAEEKEPTPNVPVHVAKVTRATLHRYIECYGPVGASQLYAGGQPSTARLASPVAGVVAEVTCALGQRVEKGAPLFQLDDRAARAEEAKAEAALA